MGALWSSIAVLILVFIAYAGVAMAGLEVLFGVVLPYVAVFTFFAGMIWRVVGWARSPVPFSIPTTCGQQKSLDWLPRNRIDCPQTKGAVFMRMVFEVLLFRSLFRNIELDYRRGPDNLPRISYASNKWLWFFSLTFHYSFLVVLLWHLRFFMDPVPFLVSAIEGLDGFLEVGLPGVLMSGLALGGAVTYLLVRRLWLSQLRYISLMSDYFPLVLILFIALTGILMRYLLRVDIMSIKQFTMSLATFHPAIPQGGLSPLFYIHLFLVSVLFVYFPFSKLVHLGGVFLSPTRNMTANSREVRHINPWNYPVKVHTYAEYEDDFRELMVEAGLPVEKPLEKAPEGETAGTE